ncbi:hypothetical protein L083_6974 [Actinoplanes sp. N902-109]|nr:hypothetical protein L083_6974 [Actinoplanes sp. N902-109]
MPHPPPQQAPGQSPASGQLLSDRLVGGFQRQPCPSVRRDVPPRIVPQTPHPQHTRLPEQRRQNKLGQVVARGDPRDGAPQAVQRSRPPEVGLAHPHPPQPLTQRNGAAGPRKYALILALQQTPRRPNHPFARAP